MITACAVFYTHLKSLPETGVYSHLQEFQIFRHLVNTDEILKDKGDLQRDAGYSYEATKLVLENLLLLLTSANVNDLDDRGEFTRRLIRSTMNSRRDGVMVRHFFHDKYYIRVPQSFC